MRQGPVVLGKLDLRALGRRTALFSDAAHADCQVLRSRDPYAVEERLLSVCVSEIAGTASEKRPSDESTVKDFVAETQLDSGRRNVALAEAVFEIVAGISEQTGDLESISQGRDPQSVPESADAAALRRRDARTDGEGRPPRGLQ